MNILDGGQLNAANSNINGSRTYEDIIVHDTASINYDTETMTEYWWPHRYVD